MSTSPKRNISLAIGGRNHVISIAPDEEAHLRVLGAMIDQRVGQQGLAGQTEARTLLVAALVLADELLALQNAPPPVPVREEPAPPVTADIEARIAALADRVEKLAARLEQSDVTP